MHRNLKCFIAGGIAGMLNGLFGAGGGLVLVLFLSSWIDIKDKRALATSIAVMLPLSIISYMLFCIQGGNVWSDALPYLIGGIAGGAIAAHIFKNIPTKWLHRAFSILLFFGGLKAVLAL